MLRHLPAVVDPHALVGAALADDAAVYEISPEVALVATVDYITPVVDDPYTWGGIAAANALSDVYAMGGKPLSSLSIVGFPEKGDPEILEQILRGGLSKMAEAQCSIVGGHSIRNDDIQFGYAVTGLIRPHRVWRNVGACAGDILLLTKSLGTGVLSTALKKDHITSESLRAAIASMTELNRAASETLQELDEKAGAARPVHAVTDITGFGLLGHAREVALGDSEHNIESVSLEMEHSAIPYLPGAVEAAREGFLPGGLKSNRDFVGDCAAFADSVPQVFRDLLFDPQTSGGLLIAISPESTEAAISSLAARGVAAQAIGRVIPKKTPMLFVR